MTTASFSNKVVHNPIELKPKDYRSAIEPTWCPGCGDFAVVSALTNALAASKIDPKASVVVSGIGCSSRLPLWMGNFGFHSVHGRAMPVAVGMKVAQPDMPVVVTIGDGDAFSIGGGHLPHAARRNFNLTLIVMDNGAYSLTKNQHSPTSREGYKGSLSPYGSLDTPMNTLALMLSYGATFVAQSYAGNPKVTADLITQAIAHKGFAFVNVLSPCPTYNKLDTFEYYRPRIHNINETHTDVTDKAAALALAEKALEHHKNPEGKVFSGLFYKVEKETYEDKLKALKARYKGTDTPDLNKIFDKYKP